MITITKNTPLKVVMELGKECDRCNKCCSFDSGIVMEEDIPQIAKHLKITEAKLKENNLVEHDRFNTHCFKFKQKKQPGKPYGKCIMLDEKKGCIIHDVKPLHCRVCSAKSKQGEALSQWFALNYLVNVENPESIRQWATFLNYNKPIPGGKLKELIPDNKKVKSILNFKVLK